jgi:hypothetical protein
MSVGADTVAEILTGTIADTATFAGTREVPSNPETPADAVVAVAFTDSVAVRPFTAVMIVPSGIPGPVTVEPGERKTFAVFTASVFVLIVVAAVKVAGAVAEEVGA